MTQTVDIPKGCRVRHVDFGGRVWTVVMVPWAAKPVPPLRRNESACIDSDMSLIMFRVSNLDTAKISLVHEILHYAFPALTERDLATGDFIFKDALDAFGVDLDALLVGYE